MASSSTRRTLLTGLGALLIVAGLVGAVVLWNAADDRRLGAIEDLARAPVGCDTTLDFIEAGRYFVFLESSGRIDAVNGDCDVDGAYELGGSRLPDVELEIRDPDGDDLSDDLDDSDGEVTYDVESDDGNFVGESIFAIDIEDRNDHVIRVASSDDDTFAIAIGQDPGDGVAALRAGALAAGLGGLAAGLVAIILGIRRRTAPETSGAWIPAASAQSGPVVSGSAGGAPQGPPTYGQPAGPPQSLPGHVPERNDQPAPAQAPPWYQPQSPPAPAVPAPPPSRRGPGAEQAVPHQPGPPDVPSGPTWARPQIRSDPAGSPQPIDWSPARDTPPRPASRSTDQQIPGPFGARPQPDPEGGATPPADRSGGPFGDEHGDDGHSDGDNRDGDSDEDVTRTWHWPQDPPN